MTWQIEDVIAGVIATVAAAIPAFAYVGEPNEIIPPDGPFCLVEYLGGPIDLGNLEEWSHGIRLTAGVKRNQLIGQERIAVRGYALTIVAALRGNVEIGGAFLTSDGEVGASAEMQYANEPFVGCSVTVRYQTSDGVENTIFD